PVDAGRGRLRPAYPVRWRGDRPVVAPLRSHGRADRVRCGERPRFFRPDGWDSVERFRPRIERGDHQYEARPGRRGEGGRWTHLELRRTTGTDRDFRHRLRGGKE